MSTKANNTSRTPAPVIILKNERSRSAKHIAGEFEFGLKPKYYQTDLEPKAEARFKGILCKSKKSASVVAESIGVSLKTFDGMFGTIVGDNPNGYAYVCFFVKGKMSMLGLATAASHFVAKTHGSFWPMYPPTVGIVATKIHDELLARGETLKK